MERSIALFGISQNVRSLFGYFWLYGKGDSRRGIAPLHGLVDGQGRSFFLAGKGRSLFFSWKGRSLFSFEESRFLVRGRAIVFLRNGAN
ncbi:hypothetical protein [Microcoleus sp. herbarium12]|uniref:hypothetical protein n=1 Tax=Microcoleus sp. herbarium12 TaxID=3055437 RepID=UPI002FD3AE6E